MPSENALNLIEQLAYIEMYVGNIFHAKNFFTNALKFKHVATKKTENSITCLMQQGNVNFLLTSSLTEKNEITEHLNKYGDCIKRLAFWVNDIEKCVENTIKHGSTLITPLVEENGIKSASINVFSYVEHEFLCAQNKNKLPGFDYPEVNVESDSMIINIDHIALCHPAGSISHWVNYYKNCFGFTENKNEDIYAEESGMHIIIMQSANGKVNLPLVEPSSKYSRLNSYLQYNQGAGVHHIAFETNDIVNAVSHYEKNHGELRKAMPKYYDEMKKLYPSQVDNIDKISPYGIMLEEDEHGVLFQIFTKPVVTRPTFFMEFIQRNICEGFGTVNIKALYDTLEVETQSQAG